MTFKYHSNSNKRFNIILEGVFLCIALLSCKNSFLDAGKVSEDIKETIAYNNAKEINVLVQSLEGTGSTVPAGKP